ncbi:hypothetical protein LTR37_009353 [Vermiconidia calcicola]|uniref:Uncharacterized protein n=1 Tax=Vermiconidia calcicola TaxID=1690605 RepID=A0ACC3N7Y1_9PEZI|nr:hypothetical protein LTR37_009353 [Vermiconidia calcicola]
MAMRATSCPVTYNVQATERHRVINKTGDERYSLAYFFTPSHDVTVETVPTCYSSDRLKKYEDVNAGEWQRERLLRARYKHPASVAARERATSPQAQVISRIMVIPLLTIVLCSAMIGYAINTPPHTIARDPYPTWPLIVLLVGVSEILRFVTVEAIEPELARIDFSPSARLLFRSVLIPLCHTAYIATITTTLCTFARYVNVQFLRPTEDTGDRMGPVVAEAGVEGRDTATLDDPSGSTGPARPHLRDSGRDSDARPPDARSPPIDELPQMLRTGQSKLSSGALEKSLWGSPRAEQSGPGRIARGEAVWNIPPPQKLGTPLSSSLLNFGLNEATHLEPHQVLHRHHSNDIAHPQIRSRL